MTNNPSNLRDLQQGRFVPCVCASLSSVALLDTAGLSPQASGQVQVCCTRLFIAGPRLKEEYDGYVDPTTEADAQEAKPNSSACQVLDQMWQTSPCSIVLASASHTGAGAGGEANVIEGGVCTFPMEKWRDSEEPIVKNAVCWATSHVYMWSREVSLISWERRLLKSHFLPPQSLAVWMETREDGPCLMWGLSRGTCVPAYYSSYFSPLLLPWGKPTRAGLSPWKKMSKPVY